MGMPLYEHGQFVVDSGRGSRTEQLRAAAQRAKSESAALRSRLDAERASVAAMAELTPATHVILTNWRRKLALYSLQ